MGILSKLDHAALGFVTPPPFRKVSTKHGREQPVAYCREISDFVIGFFNSVHTFPFTRALASLSRFLNKASIKLIHA